MRSKNAVLVFFFIFLIDGVIYALVTLTRCHLAETAKTKLRLMLNSQWSSISLYKVAALELDLACGVLI